MTQLNLEGCPFAKLPNYREEIFREFPSIAIVDDVDRKGNSYQVVEMPLYSEDLTPDPPTFVLNKDLVDQEEVDMEDFGED